MAFCGSCGAQLEDQASFCPACGSRVEPLNETPSNSVQPAAPQGADDKKGLPLGAMIAAGVAVVAAIAIIAFVAMGMFGGSNPQPANKNVAAANTSVKAENTAANTAADSASNPWIKTSWLTFGKNPGNFTYNLTQDGYGIEISDADRMVALIYLCDYYKPGEFLAKHDSYQLGGLGKDGKARAVKMWLTYVPTNTNEAKGMASAVHDADASVLAISKHGLTPETFVNSITLVNEDGSTNPVSLSGPEGAAKQQSGGAITSTASGNEAFYGVWVSATKDKAGAQSVASGYGSTAQVVLSSEWANLNSEPWYCVTYGRFKTEAEANNALNYVKQQLGVGNAYVKYSGAHK